MQRHDIIVIGASAGGVETLIKVVSHLPQNISASIFIVLHISPQSPSMMPEILSRAGRLPASHPLDGTLIEPGHIYLAPPDHHMILEKDHIRVVHGPKENRHRPAVDPLFRSAASVYGPRVVGVILTGSLDDGTAGLLAIKRQGGIAVVQDPADALYPSMPQSALNNVQVDYVVSIDKLANTLIQLTAKEVNTEMTQPVPEDMQRELNIVKMERSEQKNDIHVGTPSQYSCPECGGVLWEIQDGQLVRYRCRVGHAFSVDSMMAEQSEAIEEAMWAALKTLEEHVSISRKMANQSRANGQEWMAERFEARQNEAEKRVDLLVAVLRKDELSLPTVTQNTEQQERLQH